MKKTQRELFAELHNARKQLADNLKNPAVRSIWNSVTDKYRDQAHFVYELIQNADDAGATYADFELKEDAVVFKHNGTRHFTVTPVEDEQYKNLKHGDINAITGVSFSNKSEANTIGKFGVGFKAVFQYSNSPEIYDKYFRFELRDYIVPCELDEDYPDRLPGETVFLLPFDNRRMPAKEAYRQIRHKLENLTYPTLFLKNLQSVSYKVPDNSGLYRTTKTLIGQIKNTSIYRAELNRTRGDNAATEYAYIGMRNIGEHTIASCFFCEENGRLVRKRIPVYCFFPTNEFTRLNFLLHALFLLTDSREGIQSSNSHNEQMIEELGKLSASTLLLLRDIGLRQNQRIIDDNILNIIPCDESLFTDRASSTQISFHPVFQKIQNLFQTEKIIPTKTGYTSRENAYWPSSKLIPEVFTDLQLSQLLNKKGAYWVFTGEAGDETAKAGNPKGEYIRSLTVSRISEDNLTTSITAEFIRKQDRESLCRLYEWLSINKSRIEKSRRLPVFLDAEGNPACAMNSEGKYLLYIRGQSETTVATIHPDLMKDSRCHQLAQLMGIHEMNRDDQIENLLVQCEEKRLVQTPDYYFQEFATYFTFECPPSKTREFKERVSKLKIVKAENGEGKVLSGYYSGSELYRKNGLLSLYFGNSRKVLKSVKYVSEKYAASTLQNLHERQIDDFLKAISVSKLPRIVETTGPLQYFVLLDKHNNIRFPKPTASKRKEVNYADRSLDRLETVLEEIADSRDIERSAALWDILLSLPEADGNENVQWYETHLKAVCEYFYKKERHEEFESQLLHSLRTIPWVCSLSGRFCTPAQAGISGLHPRYTMTHQQFMNLTRFLVMEAAGSRQTEQPEKRRYETLGLNENEKKLLKYLETHTFAELEEYIENGEKLKESRRAKERRGAEDGDSDRSEKRRRSVSAAIDEVLQYVSGDGLPEYTFDEAEEELDEQDTYIRSRVDFEKRSENEKKRSAVALSKIQQQDSLTAKLKYLKKYSYGWIETLLKLEMLDNAAGSKYSHEVSLTFTKVTRDGNSARTLLLQQPSAEIPSFMEDLSDFPVTISGDKREHRIIAEAASIKSYTLRVKLKADAKLEAIDFSKGLNASISVQSPEFLQKSLLASLQRRRDANRWDDQTSLRELLPSNIEFIFGPPGTGKTTALSRELLKKLMTSKSNAKILFVTPTNKAADVLTTKIMDLNSASKTMKDWLWRYGTSVDERIDSEGILKGKEDNLFIDRKAAVITTLARFTYDMIRYDGDMKLICDIPWDYIVVDEASMVPLAEIVNLLFTGNPTRFYIAGDPFQIAPVTTAVQWKDENIYSLVKLRSFTDCKTIPYNYPVQRLMTQHRSVPELGFVYSEFQYGGKLNHKRSSDSQLDLNLGDWSDLNTVNLIRFPVSRYESIYKPKKFESGSSYQVYAALFTYEFVHNLAVKIDRGNPGRPLSIGIISPYKGQADLIEKLIHSRKAPAAIDIQVGTIHSFQGDECDLVFVVFNPPLSLKNPGRTFIENRNIINVAVSRAREYLFLLIPDEDTDGIEGLASIQELMRICHATGECAEFHASEFEERMFGKSDYLEENTFTTSHQSVNVYGLPEKKYEVRMEQSAVDVQIHERNLQPDVQENAAVHPGQLHLVKPSARVPASAAKSRHGIDQVLAKPKPPGVPAEKSKYVKPLNFSVADVEQAVYKVGQTVYCQEKGWGVIEGRKFVNGSLKFVICFDSGKEQYSEFQARRMKIMPVTESV